MIVYGGPHDGAELNSRLPGVFLFTDGRRCYRRPGKGRSLYLVKTTLRCTRLGPPYRSAFRKERVLVYIENAYGMCASCEVFHVRRHERCTLCGGALEKLPVSRWKH